MKFGLNELNLVFLPFTHFSIISLNKFWFFWKCAAKSLNTFGCTVNGHFYTVIKWFFHYIVSDKTTCKK